MVPIFIKSWNINLYGEWIILNVLSALLALLDFGYINAATNRMTFELAYGNIRNTAEVFRSMIYIINIISLALVMLIILYILNPISIFLDFKYISQSDLKIIIILIIITSIIHFYILVYGAGLTSMGYNYISLWINNFTILINLMGMSILVLNKYGPIEILLWLILTKIISLTISIILFNKKSKWVNLNYKYYPKIIIKKLIKPSLAFLSFPIAFAIKNQGYTMILGLAIGSEAVVSFTTMKTLVGSIQQIIGVINNAITPEISRAFGEKNILLAKKIHLYSCKISLLVSIGLSIFFFIFGEAILKIWTGNAINYNSNLLNLLLISMVVFSFWSISCLVITSLNYHGKLSILLIFIYALFCLIFFETANIFGIVGAGYCILASEIIVAIYVIYFSLKILNENKLYFFKNLLKFN